MFTRGSVLLIAETRPASALGREFPRLELSEFSRSNEAAWARDAGVRADSERYSDLARLRAN